MRYFVYLLLSIVLSVTLWGGSNSRISWIRAEYNHIENAVKYNEFYKQNKTSEGEGFGSEATIYIDEYGRVRKYYLGKGSEDSAMSAEYYYDKRGRMFFSFLHYGNVSGLHRDIRSYYSKDGTLIKRTLDANTDLQISYYYRIRHPKRDFKHFNPY